MRDEEKKRLLDMAASLGITTDEFVQASFRYAMDHPEESEKEVAWASFSYIVTPPIVLAFLYVAARILNEKFPKVYELLCGNRI